MLTLATNFKSLKDLCILSICDNIEHIFTPDTCLPTELSETLLLNISHQNKINDEILSFFSSENVNLRTFDLPITNNITPKGLQFLKTHQIKRIEIHSLKCTVDQLIGLLNTWTIENLEVLDVSNMLFMDLLLGSQVSRNIMNCSLNKLNNLRLLNVSRSNFSTKHLLAVAKNLPHLESLNISNTKVDNLLPLAKMKNKLKMLCVYNLRKAIAKMIDFAPLKCMTSLTHLDLSLDFSRNERISYISLLSDPYWLPNLLALDVSGSESVGLKTWEDFFTTHKKIQFLGLMYLRDDVGEIFTAHSHPLYIKNLMIADYKTKTELLFSMKCYSTRPSYIYTCLTSIKNCSKNVEFEFPEIELIQAVLDAMKCLINDYQVQTIATACLYNLTKNHVASKIHPNILANLVNDLLNTMERFHYITLIQENIYLTLNNDYLLNNVKMNNVQCAKLILNTLQFNGKNSKVIALFSKIAAKMSSSEIYHLGSHSKLVLSFFVIVLGKLSTHTIDSKIKNCISVLWSLTDESPSLCKVFIEVDGLLIFMIILNTFIDDRVLEYEVLKVLINISKMPNFRAGLLNNDIITTLRRLLQSNSINVSYCAAEIIAHVACEPDWKTYTLGNKDEVLKELEYAIKKWILPENIILTYRSFKSFIDLFNSTDMPQIQLWAAWAIHSYIHACAVNGENDHVMLDKDIGVIFFKNISSDISVNREVRDICDRIIYLMNY